MAAFMAKAIAGDFAGRVDIKTTKLFFSSPAADIFKGIHFPDAGSSAKYTPEQIKKVIQLSSESSKSFSGSALTGIAGGLLLGGAGLVAGALAGGRNTISRIGVEFDDGSKVVLEQEFNDKYLQCLLLYAKSAGVMEQNLGF
jgi:hypothetical protein